MIIEKQATTLRFLRSSFWFPSARSAFGAFLKAAGVRPSEMVLLPSYIGWSAREGSGVFDPVDAAQCGYAFYPVDEQLRIDTAETKKLLKRIRPKVFVLIHYFGFPDASAAELAQYALEQGALVMEDEAHAMLSDLIGGVCGRLGTASIFSLHKLLPVKDGGVLVMNATDFGVDPGWRGCCDALNNFDLYAIARKRRENANALISALGGMEDLMVPLYSEIPHGVIPQTLPVIIKNADRDQLYFALNEAGYGVVSLYHTLIKAVKADAFPASYWLSRNIMNLPVHQDIDERAIQSFAECIRQRSWRG